MRRCWPLNLDCYFEGPLVLFGCWRDRVDSWEPFAGSDLDRGVNGSFDCWEQSHQGCGLCRDIVFNALRDPVVTFLEKQEAEM